MVDVQFKKRRDIIHSKQQRLRVQQTNTNKEKFTIHTTTIQQKGNEPFIDALLKHVEDSNLSIDMIEALFVYLKQEQFDTDSLKLDWKHYAENESNLNRIFNDETMINLIVDEIAFSESYFMFIFRSFSTNHHYIVICVF